MTRLMIEYNGGAAAQIRKAIRDGNEVEYGIRNVPGLCVRVRKSSATWAVRGDIRGGARRTTKRIGDFSSVEFATARERCHHARNMMSAGEDPGNWLREMEIGMPIIRTAPASEDGWTFEKAREKYLAWVGEHRRKDTLRGYKDDLHHADVAPVLSGKLLKHISPEDVKRIRETIATTNGSKTSKVRKTGPAVGRPAMANKVLTSLRAFFSWCVTQHGDSKLETNPAANVEKVRIAESNGAKRFGKMLAAISNGDAADAPSKHELGLVNARLRDAKLAHPMRLAGLIALHTAQRRITIVQAEREAIGADAGREGWGVWYIDSAHMKAGTAHVLPLPPPTYALFKEALAIGRSSDRWLFPQLRLRRAGDAGSSHMSEKALNDAFATAGIAFSPHKIRSAFATYMIMEHPEKYTKADTALILHHAQEKRKTITSRAYEDLLANMPRMRSILQDWLQLIDRFERRHS